MRRLHSERRLGRISYPHASHKLPRRSSPAQANFRSSFHSYRGPTCVDDVPVSDDRLVGALIDVSSYEVPRDEDMLNTRMENGRVGVARSTVDMHRVRVRNRASVGATVARRAYSPAPYLCMRIDATRLFGAEIVLGNR
ncbi:hypothetical protein EVAR_103277_1 [Eumeta japonica]|uniref:Uncharacterized protein n=1 Tax=Eumeta variegata TaxID=151549 RepID=A0A4C1XT57_EUMVA|nr:hypothetical protein EVAR_103277_1 [Eumeta japonica]